jgi:hypothetical protein
MIVHVTVHVIVHVAVHVIVHVTDHVTIHHFSEIPVMHPDVSSTVWYRFLHGILE